MCTHQRFVFNPYSRQNVLVSCGHCPACQQEKAFKRVQRIHNNLLPHQISLFITLTYANDFVPYVDLNDLFLANGFGDVPVRRDYDFRYVYDRHSGLLKPKKYRHFDGVGSNSVYVFDASLLDYSYLDTWHHLNGKPHNHCGVAFYPDIQRFWKRLRQILIRNYNYEKSFSYYACSELGSESQRPHFHALLFINRDDETLFRSAIVQAWPYADSVRTARYIEVARDCANYVASYVNRSSDLQLFRQADMFKQKHSFSKHFGVCLDCFSLSEILHKIDDGDLSYYRQQKFDGETSVSRLPIPLYVLHRYFPLLKGFSRLSPCQLRTILLCPEECGFVLNDFKNIVNKVSNPLYSFTPKESYKIYVCLENCYKYFHEQTGLSRFDYAYYFDRCYRVYFSTSMKYLHDPDKLIDYSDFYENGFFVDSSPDVAPTLSIYLPNLILDPNKLSDVCKHTVIYTRLFERLDKQKRVTNFCMTRMGHNV